MKEFGSAIILAGGKSSRMGFDKQFLKFGNKSLLQEIIKNLKQEFNEIILVTNKPKVYNNSDYIVVSDDIKGIGPVGGLHKGLQYVSSKYAYVTACDMPVISQGYIKFAKEKLKEKNADVCVTYLAERIQPLNGFYSKNILEKLEEYIAGKRYSIKSFLEKLNCFYINEEEFKKQNFNKDIFFNLNTLEDVKEYLQADKGVVI